MAIVLVKLCLVCQCEMLSQVVAVPDSLVVCVAPQNTRTHAIQSCSILMRLRIIAIFYTCNILTHSTSRNALSCHYMWCVSTALALVRLFTWKLWLKKVCPCVYRQWANLQIYTCIHNNHTHEFRETKRRSSERHTYITITTICYSNHIYGEPSKSNQL